MPIADDPPLGGQKTWTAEEDGSPASPVSGMHAPPVPAGRYGEPTEVLGIGGIGRVVLVFDHHLQRFVARKEMHLDNPASRARFLNEARITARLDHPGIVPVYELGRDADGRLYYTMRPIHGRSLAEALSQTADLTARLELLPHFLDACQAIAWAHSRDVVHRDLKPANVMVGAFGETQVVDWGIAKVLGDGEEAATPRDFTPSEGGLETLVGTSLGTPAYMSPEQARGEHDTLDERTDVFGLGAILFEILTGRPPIPGDAMSAMVRAERGDVEDVAALEPHAPAELVAVVRRALQADPEARYSSAAALAADVTAFQRGAVVSAYRYSKRERLFRFASAHRQSLVLLSVAGLAATAALTLSWRSVLTERDRAVAAERATEVQLARSLSQAALGRYDAYDDPSALVLAAVSLRHEEGVRARGVLLAAGNGWLPVLEWVAEPGVSCSVGEFSPSGESFACRGAEEAYRWNHWPDGPPLRVSLPMLDPLSHLLTWLDGDVLGLSHAAGAALWSPGEATPGVDVFGSQYPSLVGVGERLVVGFYQEGWRTRVAATSSAGEVLAVAEFPANLCGLVALDAQTVGLADSDGQLYRWTPTGTALERWGAAPSCASLVTDRDGGLVYASGTTDGGGSRIAVFDREGALQPSLEGPAGDALGLALDPLEDRLFSGTRQGTNLVLSRDGRPLGRMPVTGDPQALGSFSREGWLAVSGGDGRPRVYSLPPGEGPGLYPAHAGPAFFTVFDGSEGVISTGYDGRVVRLARDGAAVLEAAQVAEVPLGGVLVRGDVLWVADDRGRLHTLDRRTLAPTAAPQFLCSEERILARAATSPDGARVAFACHDGRAVFLDDQANVIGRTAPVEGLVVVDGAAWFAGGARLAVVGRLSEEVLVFDTDTFELAARHGTGPCGGSYHVANWREDEVLLAGTGGVCVVGADGSVSRLPDLSEKRQYIGIEVSPDGRWVVGLGWTDLAFWSAEDRTQRAVVPLRGRAPWGLSFDATSSRAAVSFSDGYVAILDLEWLTADPERVLAEAEVRQGVHLRDGAVVEVDGPP